MRTSEQLTVCKIGYVLCGFWFAFKERITANLIRLKKLFSRPWRV